MTCPTFTLSPCFTRTSFTSPLTDEGTSTTAFSVSNSMTAWPSDILAPGEIISRTRSPCSIFSPSSGRRNSLAFDAAVFGLAVFYGEDHLADFNFLSFFDPNILDCPAHRRWNFDHCLVGFQFHHCLAFGDIGPRRNHQPDQI